MPKFGKKSNKAKAPNNQVQNTSNGANIILPTKKELKKQARKGKIRDKMDMYDMIVANLIAGKSIIEPSQKLDNSQIAIGFSNIASENQISKFFLVRQLPDYMQPRLIDLIRSRCIRDGVKINFSFFCSPYKINWDSAEMRNKMTIWKRYADEHSGPIDVFDYRTQRTGELARRRIIQSTKYLNEAELDYRRTLLRVAFVIEISAKRDDESILNMIESIKQMRQLCSSSDIKLRELRVDMINWLQTLGVFSLAQSR